MWLSYHQARDRRHTFETGLCLPQYLRPAPLGMRLKKPQRLEGQLRLVCCLKLETLFAVAHAVDDAVAGGAVGVAGAAIGGDAVEGVADLDEAADGVGGNCVLTEAGKTVVKHGVTLVGETNLAALVAADASALYARNVLDFLKLVLSKDGQFKVDLDDDIVAACLMTQDGVVKRK